MGKLVRFLLVALVAGSLASPAVAAGTRRVCLDPGHGGTDPGAVRGSLQEKNITLDVALRLRALLEAAYDVTLTRTDGATRLGNSDRAVICNAASAEIVISIHLNATTDAKVDYAWVFYGKRSKDLALAQTIDASYQIMNAAGTAPLAHKTITNFANGTLLKSNAPAVLVETLFLSNTAEQSLLGDGTGTRQQQIAEQLHAGIVEWFRTH